MSHGSSLPHLIFHLPSHSSTIITMGSLCGKESPSSGRVPGSTSASSRTSLLPNFMSKKPQVGGPGRTLGGSSAGYHETDGEESAPVDARAAAALAAEVIISFSPKRGSRIGADACVPVRSDVPLLPKRAGNWHLSWSSRNERRRINIFKIGQTIMDSRSSWFGTR